MRRSCMKCQQPQDSELESLQLTWAHFAFHHPRNSWSKLKINHRQAAQMPILTSSSFKIWHNNCHKAFRLEPNNKWMLRTSKPRLTNSSHLRSSNSSSSKEAFHNMLAKWNVILTQTNHHSTTACATEAQCHKDAKIIILNQLTSLGLKRRSSSSNRTQWWDSCSKVKYDWL